MLPVIKTISTYSSWEFKSILLADQFMINGPGIVLEEKTFFYLMLFDAMTYWAVFDEIKVMEGQLCVSQKLELKVKRNSLQISGIITI